MRRRLAITVVRAPGDGKKITAIDGVAAFYYIIRYNLFCSLAQSFESPAQLKTKEVDTGSKRGLAAAANYCPIFCLSSAALKAIIFSRTA